MGVSAEEEEAVAGAEVEVEGLVGEVGGGAEEGVGNAWKVWRQCCY